MKASLGAAALFAALALPRFAAAADIPIKIGVLSDRTGAYADAGGAGSELAARFDGRMPTMLQAGTYSSITHYLKAVDALHGKDAGRVMAEMRKMPVDDALFGHGRLRADGRVVHNMYLFEVKTPAESKYPYDYHKLLATIPPDEAFRPESEGGCPLVK